MGQRSSLVRYLAAEFVTEVRPFVRGMKIPGEPTLLGVAAGLFEYLVELFLEPVLVKNVAIRISGLSSLEGVEDRVKFIRAVY